MRVTRWSPGNPVTSILALLLLAGCARTHDGEADADADRDAATPIIIDGGSADAERDAGEDPACLERTSVEGFERFLRDVVLARCEQVIACGGARFDWASAEDCARYDADANNHAGWPARCALIRDGVFTLDLGRRDACLDEIRACPPSPAFYVRLDSLRLARPVGRVPPACWNAVRLRCPGPRATERCVIPGRAGCAEGLYCEPDECDPTCREPGGAGAPCSGVEACRDVAAHDYVYCDRPGDLTMLGTCRGADTGPSAGADERCGLVDLGDGFRVVECDPGLECWGPSAGEHRCIGSNPDGEPCGGDGCLAGSFCDDGVCAPRAGAYAPVPVGAPCATPDGDCERQHRTTCVDGVCTEVGRAAGQRCDPRRWDSSTGVRVERCDPGLACDEVSVRCVEVRPIGEACSIDVGCESGCCLDGACRASSDCPLPWCE